MDNNKAFIATLKNVRPIAGADNIDLADLTLDGVTLAQLVVGKGTPDGLRVVYFDANMALSDEFIDAIDRTSPDYGKDDFKSIGTYLAKGNRVRCIKLRGVISNGLMVEEDRFERAIGSIKDLPEGYSFLEFNGFEVCHKWLPPVKKAPRNNKEHKGQKKRVSRVIPDQFRFYVDTAQLLRNLHEISPEDVISVSRKIHGTSAICSNALVLRKLTLRDKVAKLFGVKVQDKEYAYLYASRTVVKNDAEGTGFYGVDVWSVIGKKYFEGKLHQGESVYYEIVGYLPGTQSMIQGGYDYGNRPGDCSIAVYRITETSPDGSVSSLDWAAMKERCVELQVPMVQEYYYGKASAMYPAIPIDDEWRANFANALAFDYLEKDVWDNLGKKVPDEGIVLRVEGLGIRVYKLKSQKFFKHESDAREAEELDIEAEEGAVDAE